MAVIESPLSSVPSFPEAHAELLEEIERYRTACGCEAGGVGAVIGLVSVMAWQFAVITTLSLSTAAGALVEIVAAMVLGGVVGKLIGLGRARTRLRRATARLLGQSPRIHEDASGARST